MNKAFSLALPTLQWAWDNTSLATLMACPRKYQLSIIEGWSPRAESAHLKFGICYHHALEVYDHARALGADDEAATIAAVRDALTSTWNKELGRPWSSDIPEKNRESLVRSVVWYLEQFKDDPIETVILANGKPAVELSFRWETDMYAPTGERVVYCGHLDKVGKFGRDLFILDRKTTKYAIGPDYFEKYSPDNQMSGYDFAGDVVYKLPIKGVIVDAAQVLVTLSRFKRGLVPRTTSQRAEWYQTAKYYIKMAFHYAESAWWPMNTSACGMYGGCPFRPICGRAPEVREQWLRGTFKKRVWDPLTTRGDV